MRTKYNELSIGISVTAATLIVVFGILLLGKSSFLVHGMLINMSVENAEGLGTGDSVLYRGIVSGTVQSIALDQNGVLVVLKLPGSPKIPVDSRFAIKDSSLLGGKEVDITAGSSAEYFQPNARVNGQSQAGLLGIAQDTSGISSKVSSILSNVDALSGPQTSQNLYATLRDLNAISRTLKQLVAENSGNVTTAVTNLQQASKSATATMDNLSQISGDNRVPIKKVIAQMDQATLELDAVIQKTSTTVDQLNAFLGALQKGQGSLGKLMVDDSLYVEMEAAVKEFDGLVKDIKANPKKYVTVKIF